MTRVHAFSAGDFGENGYLAMFEDRGLGVAVDPGAAASAMAEHLEAAGVRLEAILLTHAHLDHVEGIPALRRIAPSAPIYLHPADRPLYDGVEAQARAFGLRSAGPLPPPDLEMDHGQTLTFGGCEFRVRHAPGHAPGHVIFHLPTQELAFVGDVIFRGAIGRADLMGGDYYQLMESIRSQVLTLPDETRLLSGHGPETTVGWERKTNPFLVGQYGGEFA